MPTFFENVTVVILAAGLGKRMKSNRAKVLHKVDGKEMILHVVEASKKIAGENIVVVVGYQAKEVENVVSRKHRLAFAYQDKQLGTGHAVMQAMPCLKNHTENVVILCGDVPLVKAESLKALVEDHEKNKRDVTVLAVETPEPTGYGRILFDRNHRVTGIVEEADALESQKKIKTINTGIYCIRHEFLKEGLMEIKPENAQGEYYLTDIIDIGCKADKNIGAIVGVDPDEFVGINSLEELEKVEAALRRRMHKMP